MLVQGPQGGNSTSVGPQEFPQGASRTRTGLTDIQTHTDIQTYMFPRCLSRDLGGETALVLDPKNLPKEPQEPAIVLQTYRYTDIQTYIFPPCLSKDLRGKTALVLDPKNLPKEPQESAIDLQTYRHTNIHFSPYAFPRTSGGKQHLSTGRV